MKKSIEIPHPAVVLCGGRGSRLGAVSEKMPKPMVEVQGRPMIWYIVLNLYKHGVREFIFPLGYMGHSIRDYISNEFYHIDCKLHFKETGENTPIAGRINQIMHLIDEEDDFLLVNGDTFFDFDLNKMFCMHKNNKSLLTLSSISVKSAYGLIVEDQDNSICGFARDKSIEHFVVEENNIYRQVDVVIRDGRRKYKVDKINLNRHHL